MKMLSSTSNQKSGPAKTAAWKIKCVLWFGDLGLVPVLDACLGKSKSKKLYTQRHLEVAETVPHRGRSCSPSLVRSRMSMFLQAISQPRRREPNMGHPVQKGQWERQGYPSWEVRTGSQWPEGWVIKDQVKKVLLSEGKSHKSIPRKASQLFNIHHIQRVAMTRKTLPTITSSSSHPRPIPERLPHQWVSLRKRSNEDIKGKQLCPYTHYSVCSLRWAPYEAGEF